MPESETHDISTRQRLLAASCRLFGEKGYRNTTVADICKNADANIAAVNYHFGSKEHLYAEAWKYAFQRSIENNPPEKGVTPEDPPEKRLKAHILSVMHRIADTESREFEIVHKELANPTGLLEDVMRESLSPLQKKLTKLVRELLGTTASETQVRLCQMSIKAQCFDLMVGKRMRKMHKAGHPLPGPPPLDIDTDTVAEHILEFSLAGIREIRRRNEQNQALVEMDSN